VLELDPVEGPRTYVNPQVMRASPEMIQHREGSVSMPGVHDEVQRHARVRISFSDLDGLFWIQRLSRLKRERLIKRFEKLSRG
jgi:peptide deformylase